MAVHVVLNELGLPFTLENASIQAGGTRTAEFLAINPRGQIPVLVDDGQVIREGAAILMHLLDNHPNKLLPREGLARTTALEWLMFCNATLHPAYARGFFLMKNATDPAAKEQLLGVCVAQINNLWSEVESRLGQSAFLAGDKLTVADILLTVIANWSRNFNDKIQIGPRTKALLQTVINHPSYKKALEVEQVEYKVAA